MGRFFRQWYPLFAIKCCLISGFASGSSLYLIHTQYLQIANLILDIVFEIAWTQTTENICILISVVELESE